MVPDSFSIWLEGDVIAVSYAMLAGDFTVGVEQHFNPWIGSSFSGVYIDREGRRVINVDVEDTAAYPTVPSPAREDARNFGMCALLQLAFGAAVEKVTNLDAALWVRFATGRAAHDPIV
jgi:hypothetical protein